MQQAFDVPAGFTWIMANPIAQIMTERDFRRNYAGFIAEGGIYVGGMAFLSAQTVMPTMVESLGGPTWAIAVMPTMMAIGFALPALLTAHRIERLHRMKPIVMLSGILQRLPYLIAGLLLVFAGRSWPRLTLWAVVLTPLASGIAGGVTMGAFQELVARTIPERRRASLWGLRQIITTSIGFAAGLVVTYVLDAHPSYYGYGLLHLFAFGFLVISYIIFLMLIREHPPVEAHEHNPECRSFRENMGQIFQALRSHGCFRRVALARFFRSAQFIMLPLLAIHIRASGGLAEGALGYFVSAGMCGGIVGNMFAAWLGDRAGGKVVLLIGTILAVGISVGSIFAAGLIGGMAIFFAVGICGGCLLVGQSTLAIEICPEGRRPSYMALLSFVMLVGMILAAAICTLIQSLPEGRAFLISAILSAVGCAISAVFLAAVHEPRKSNGSGA